MAQTNIQTDGHGDYMTDPAQRAESVKILLMTGDKKSILISQIYWTRLK